MIHRLPPVYMRELIDTHLSNFFNTEYKDHVYRARELLCDWYKVKPPTILWDHKWLRNNEEGLCLETGKILLRSPKAWKRMYMHTNTERRWIRCFNHEFGHYLYWCDPEAKANSFAYQMVLGLDAYRERKHGQRNIGSKLDLCLSKILKDGHEDSLLDLGRQIFS